MVESSVKFFSSTKYSIVTWPPSLKNTSSLIGLYDDLSLNLKPYKVCRWLLNRKGLGLYGFFKEDIFEIILVISPDSLYIRRGMYFTLILYKIYKIRETKIINNIVPIIFW